ncbi:uncharacterized protein BP5553_08822 [Venustampulla echinocandica]|uniref:Uncharacterized protein n=1 Tax=Venustampulla echinocandica TaxID=2656787 RepID=A0A370TD39_9HELO|nr:uncharacterized protein BP5553_08822 [Venustampulla echinocandica]RDL32366.1 hypothetical protein BP5553_08822 [Venustampulla echinocandica]
MADSNVSIPMKLDAFVFNQDVCDGDSLDSKIAPITQPNYTFLRVGNQDYLLQNDLVDLVDLANATPYQRNARLMNLGSGEMRESRLGVYLHWILPRPYRTGAAATPQGAPRSALAADAADPTAPQFRNPPTRWLIIRKLDLSTIKPAGADIKPVEGWVVESDRVRALGDLTDSVDLQVDISPYILSTKGNATDPANIDIGKQAEIFVGYKADAATWKEPGDAETRVNLNLLNSSNQLFPDYQPHNSNVFSVTDTFSYVDADGNPTSLTDAAADYYVMGWHESSADDPFTLNGDTRSSRLSELNMTLNDMPALDDWLSSSTNTRVICHGAMYGVEWHRRWDADGEPNRPKKVLADIFTKDLIEKMPIAVGTTAMDTVLAYIHAHHEDELESDINRISTLLRAQSDSVTDQQAGEDEVQNYNFSTVGGGAHFVMPIEDDRPAQPPTEKDQKNLKLLNQAQALVDSTGRALERTQWDIFSLWWKYETDVDNKLPEVMEKYKVRADLLTAEYKALVTLLGEQQATVQDIIDQRLSQKPKMATLREYAQARDPSVVVAGAKPGWPEDFLDNLICRLDYQIDTFYSPSVPAFDEFFIECVPLQLQKTALALAQEFVQYTPARPAEETEVARLDYETFPPLYHDRGNPSVEPPLDAPWRDRWESTQPWFPLYVEWEAEFFDVEYDKWALEYTTSRMESQPKFHHAIAPGSQPLWEDKDVVQDTRTLSGRTLILPQATFNLKAQIDQLFSSTPPEVLDQYLSPKERAKLQANVSTMALLSLPMGGFINQLTTTMEGNHLKPNIRVPGEAPIPMKGAYLDSEVVNLGWEQIKAIGIESDLTPYGSLVPLPDTSFAAFKPATHGQFRFTKLTIVDKFGQCAPAIDPHPRRTGPPPLYPCLSDLLAPQNFDGGYANVAIKPESTSVCEFAQVPPQINQPSRLNAKFVVRDEDASDPAYWRPAREWENPIWGWVVVNYVDNGVQFFLKDGSFYREARAASRENPFPVAATARWTPFGRGSSSPDTDQIDRLINQFTDSKEGQQFLEDFIAMITASVDHAVPATAAYGPFLTALVGKPLALVNAAYSLELSADARANESTLKSQDGLHTKYHLLRDPSDTGSDVYNFALKLGDAARLHDGLVGYFQASSKPWECPPGGELNLDTLYTNYTDVSSKSRFEPIDTSTFPTLEAYYLSPSSFAEYEDPGAAFAAATHARFNPAVFGCIVDPFVPLHAYTGGGIAPVAGLALPDWTWRGALDQMTAFFHVGPLLVTGDTPGFDVEHALPANYGGKLEELTFPGSALELPSLRAAEWRWLQGYRVDDPGQVGSPGEAEEGGEDDGLQKFMALGLGKLDATPRFQPGPYTAIEGYLQMAKPIQTSQSQKGGT